MSNKLKKRASSVRPWWIVARSVSLPHVNAAHTVTNERTSNPDDGDDVVQQGALERKDTSALH